MSDLKKRLNALLALQNEYIKQVEDESPDHEESIKYYIELIDELKTQIKLQPIKFAKNIVLNKHFQSCLEAANASVYLPILDLVQMMFRGHKYLATLIIQEIPEAFIETVKKVSIHLKFTYEALLFHEGHNRARSHNRTVLKEDLEEETDPIYSKSEAKSIADLSARLMKSFKDASNDVLTFIIIEIPEIIQFMSKCATLMNSREFSRLAMALIEEEEKIREIELKTAATMVIQSFWRSVLVRRRWQKMRAGFVALQKLYRKRLQSREGDLWRQFRNSEKKFQLELEEFRDRRHQQEKIYESIRQTPSSQLMNLSFKNSDASLMPKSAENLEMDPQLASSLVLVNEREATAAMTIQTAVRRWLNRRIKEHLAKSQPYLNKPITEERAIKLQQEIDAWQHHHKVPPMTPNEFAELHHKAQLRYAKFCQSLLQSRRREQKTMAIVAQSKNIIDVLETRPDLHSYNPNEDWQKFHSLPLHIATKARLDHNVAVAKLQMPTWQRILED